VAKTYEAFDGALNAPEFTLGLVQFHDLTTRLTLASPADVVLSLEVGEHLPAIYQDVFLDSLVNNARCWIVLSWAPPGAPGLGHVNELVNERVVELMRARGWSQLVEVQEAMRAAVHDQTFFKKSLMVFGRPNGIQCGDAVV